MAEDDPVEGEDVLAPEQPPLVEPIIMPFATVEDWVIHNPILKDGQIGIEYELTTGASKLKAGFNGKRWNELPYTGGGNGGAKPTMKLMAEGDEDALPPLEQIPAPAEVGYVLLSYGSGSCNWVAPDPGELQAPTIYQPKLLRNPANGNFGPPVTLVYGVLAINFAGDTSNDKMPSLYIGDINDKPIRLLSEGDIAAFVRPKQIAVSGGTDVADAFNKMAEPLVVAEGDLYMVYYSRHSYLFGAMPGRYGGVAYNGPGGPGQSVLPEQFVLAGCKNETATTTDIINGSAPDRSIHSDASFLEALDTLLTMNGLTQGGTVGGAGKIILTNALGKIDPTFLPAYALGLIYGGSYSPTLIKQYPTFKQANELWVVNGLDEDGFTWTSGDLDGLRCHNGDQMIWDGANWALIELTTSYGMLPKDGSLPMSGDLDMDRHDIKGIAKLTINPLDYMAATNAGLPTTEGLILDGGTF